MKITSHELEREARQRRLPEAIVLENGPEVRWRGLAAWSEERWGAARASSEQPEFAESLDLAERRCLKFTSQVLPVQMLNSIHGSGPVHRRELP